MSTELNKHILEALDDLKAKKVVEIKVSDLSDVMDYLIIANGTSSRHVKSLANHVIEDLKSKGYRPFGSEGVTDGEWALVDFGDTVVHVMQPDARDFYELEKLWSKVPANRDAAAGETDGSAESY